MSFCVYLITLTPTVYVGDSGELTTAAYLLGISHPPGYPLYAILAKLVTILVPFGNIAFRVNLFSAICSSLTVLILYNIIKNRSNNSYIAVFSSFIFAFSPVFWSQSCCSEVYSLNMFCVATLLLIFLNTKMKIVSKWIFLVFLIMGIGFSNHQTIILFFPVLLAVLINIFKQKMWRLSILLFLLFFLGCSIYFYLVIRSSAFPLLDWGHPRNLVNLLKHIFRQQYSKAGETSRSVIFVVLQWWIVVKLIFKQFYFFLVPIAIVGIFFKKNLLILLFAIFMIILPFVISFNPDPFSEQLIEVFFIPAYFIFAIWIGDGFIKLHDLAKSMFLKIGIIILCIGSVLFVYKKSYAINDKSKNMMAYEFGQNLIATLGAKECAFLEGDNVLFPLAYLIKIENQKIDGSYFDETGNVFDNVYGEEFMNMSAEEHGKRLKETQKSISEVSSSVYWSLGTTLANTKDLLYEPYGLLLRKGDKQASLKMWRIYRTKQMLPNPIDMDYMYRDLLAMNLYFLGEYEMQNSEEQGLYVFGLAGKAAFDNDSIHINIANALLRRSLNEKAINYYEEATRINPYSSANYYNFGFCLAKLNKHREAVLAFENAIKINQKNSDAWIGIGTSSVALGGEFESRAFFAFQKAIEVNPRNAKAHYNTGAMYGNKRQLKEAIREFEIAIELDPSYSQALVALEQAKLLMLRSGK